MTEPGFTPEPSECHIPTNHVVVKVTQDNTCKAERPLHSVR